MKAVKIRTPEERQKLLKEVESLTAEMGRYPACKKVGINPTQYYAWKRKSKAPRKYQSKVKKPELLTVNLPMEGTVFLFQGTQSDLDKLVRLREARV